MPLYYQLYEDYEQNKERLNIEQAIKKLDIPILICHGELDTAVPPANAFILNRWQPAAKLFTIESDHVFGRSHPWESALLPAATEAVVVASIQFLQGW